jgi:hypothetical protein
MSEPFYILLEDDEARRIDAAAARDGLSKSEWVRRVLLAAAEPARVASAEEKLAAVRTAMEFDAPVADIEVMLAEIEQGYLPPLGDSSD